jgi:putative salt-induced outer membrane protein YdiY
MRRTTWLALLLIFPLTQAGAETLELVNGDKLSGEVIERTEDHVVLDHAVLGRVTVPTAKLESPEPVNPGLFGTGFLRGWKRSIEMGLSGASGNSETKDLRAGVNLGYEDKTRRWKFEARYLFSEQDHDTSQNNFRTILNRDFLLPNSRWFYFAGGRYDWDDFQNWEHRLTLGGGPGYELFTSESFNLRGRIGPSLTIQRGDDDDVKGELLLGLEAVWRISEAQTLNLSNSIFPALSDPGEFRNVTNADWIVQLSERHRLALKLGLENDYDSSVDSDTEKNDLKYYGSLLYSF